MGCQKSSLRRQIAQIYITRYLVVDNRRCDNIGAPPITRKEAERRLAKLGKVDKVAIKKWIGFNSLDNEVVCHCGNEYTTSGRNLIGTDKPHPYSGCKPCINQNKHRPPANGEWSNISEKWKDDVEELMKAHIDRGSSKGTIAHVRRIGKKIALRYSSRGIDSAKLLTFEEVKSWYDESPSAHEKGIMWEMLFSHGHGLIVYRLDGSIPKSFWEVRGNRCEILQYIATQMNPPWIHQADWLKLDKSKLPNGLVNWYKNQSNYGTYHDCVHEIFDDWKYYPWDFINSPNVEHWKSDALEYIAITHGWDEDKDWYNLQEHHFDVINRKLIGYYKHGRGGIPIGPVMDIHPELLEEPWEFVRCPVDWRTEQGKLNIGLAKRWVDCTSTILGCTKISELKDILKKEHFEKYGGYGLYQSVGKYVERKHGRIPDLLILTHPEYEDVWNKWSKNVDSELKDPLERNRRMEEIARIRNINEIDEWYRVGRRLALDTKWGGGLIAHHGGWIPALEEHTGKQFHQWLFEGGVGKWTDELVVEWREWVANEQGLPGADSISKENESRWLYVDRGFLKRFHASGLRKRFGKMLDVILGLFDGQYEFSEEFKKEYFKRTQSALERAMDAAIRRLFDLDDTDWRMESSPCIMNKQNLGTMGINSGGLRFSKTNALMSVDRIIPQIKMGFEAQGQQHYSYNTYYHKTEDDFYHQKRRDEEKSAALEDDEVKITLVIVPYWWDYTATSLASIIKKQTGKSIDEWKKELAESTQ